MKIKKCDRCGAEISYIPMGIREYIKYTVRNDRGALIDLCLNCLNDLEKWMDGKEEDDAEVVH